ncbi:Retrovirus-related Pol polyprotein LINE-1 [Zea mays]|uniref:Retrovirus-related Pol polyprotein LINE-1 n=1 Tax=Zea mays TaxID=4577 RepID=A0A1D6MK50_MAIZE|nr:Retrovirus-related Pol polyprotein LINE-1 [Zea mays]
MPHLYYYICRSESSLCVLTYIEIRTSTVEINDESRGRPFQKAKIEIILGKSDKFDELMAAAAEERGEVEDGEEQA